MKNKKRIFLKWCLVIGWLLFIFIMSTDVGSSSNTYGIVQKVSYAINILDIKHMPLEMQAFTINLLNFGIRKCAHVSEYLILSVLLISLCKEYDKHGKELLFIVLSFSFIYATFDELHQLFIPSRTGNPEDVLFDLLGAYLGSLICFIFYENQKIKQAKSFRYYKKSV